MRSLFRSRAKLGVGGWVLTQWWLQQLCESCMVSYFVLSVTVCFIACFIVVVISPLLSVARAHRRRWPIGVAALDDVTLTSPVCDAVIGWSFQWRLCCSSVITRYPCVGLMLRSIILIVSSRCQAIYVRTRRICAYNTRICSYFAYFAGLCTYRHADASVPVRCRRFPVLWKIRS